MSVARIYRMTATAGQGDALAAALAGLVPPVLAQPGCLGVDTYRDLDNPDLFLFVEKWASVEAHKAGLGAMPKDVLAPVMAALAGPPEGSYAGHIAA